MESRAVVLAHESIATEAKHWVRLTAACNSKCVFCLDAEAQDGRFMDWDHITREIRRGREEKDATRLVVSGGEATIHPRFHDAVRYGKEVGYRWVQTVTNGQKLADREFYRHALDAGLDEVTFSLHGHTPELHDRLTRTKHGFENLLRAMMRATREGRLVVNVDVCINRQNVEHLEAIVALCARVGVREFDLLHVIPQGVAWDNRAELFYDPDQHADALRRVFGLARRGGFHIWTNRFPVAHLEGVEELIQDPHKMLDEVGGRRLQFRKYLDGGETIECRDAERCPHCFIQPFCAALDRHVADQHAGRFDVWWVGDHPAPGPPTRYVGLSRPDPTVPGPWYARFDTYPELPPGSIAVAWKPEHLSCPGELEVELTPEIVAVLPAEIPARWRLHVPAPATAEEAAAQPDWRTVFGRLPPGTRVSGVPACLAPGMVLEPELRVLDAALFHDDGRLGIDAFVHQYVQHAYRAKSLRCRGCAADRSCAGASLQYLRAHGFGVLQPSATATGLGGPPAMVAQPGSLRVPVPGNPPVPEIDVLPGRRS